MKNSSIFNFDKSEKKALAITITIVFIFWLLGGIFPYIIFKSENRAYFGEMYGAINSLFSGLAFSMLIFTILLQHKSIEMQSEELKSQSKNQDEIIKQMDKQAKYLKEHSENQLLAAKINSLTSLYNVENDAVKNNIMLMQQALDHSSRFAGNRHDDFEKEMRKHLESANKLQDEIISIIKANNIDLPII